MDEELDRRMYWYAVEELKRRGYVHYEISNFAFPGYECRHNMVYWKAEEYLGVGAGAHSYLEGARYGNTCGIEGYIDGMASDSAGSREDIQLIDANESMAEFMILGLRLIGGIAEEEFKSRYGVDVFKIYGKRLDKLLKERLLERSEGRLRLSPYGLDIANSVFVEFI